MMGDAQHRHSSGHAYTPCYCEENVHLLCQALLRDGGSLSSSSLWVVFITNPAR
jgi:hypothetical protein